MSIKRPAAPKTRSSTDGLGISVATAPLLDNPAEPGAIFHTGPQFRATTVESPKEALTPSSADLLIFSPPASSFTGSTQYERSPISPQDIFVNSAKPSLASLRSSAQPLQSTHSEASLLPKRVTSSLHSRYEEFARSQTSSSSSSVKRGRANWLYVTTLVLSVYSSALSILFLLVAAVGPRYGRLIRTNGVLTASSAAFLTTILAKTIEMSFVTVILALLGQELSRRAHGQRSVTLAEISMRSWIVQPGTMISRWETVRYAGISTLGFMSVFAAILAMLYTTAATALVQPQLKFADWSQQSMQGRVKASFANPVYIGENCNTPVTSVEDPIYRNSTCLALEHAAMGYHNYYTYMSQWENSSVTEEYHDPAARPKGTALLYDNTTVTAPWVGLSNPVTVHEKTGAIISNFSLAMPHTGVGAAARNQINDIMQPSELDGLGVYEIRASVPSPVVHVLCASMDQQHLAPFVFNMTTQPALPDLDKWYDYIDGLELDPYLGDTDLDDVFGWGEKYGSDKWPPIFPIYPLDYNTLVNGTISYGRDSIYILGKANSTLPDGSQSNGLDYALCQLKVSQTPNCSTLYTASSSGATLEAVCNDPEDKMQYSESVPHALRGNATISTDWPNIAFEWALSLSLNSGIVNGDAANARLLTQFITREPKLNPSMPSMAEALAVMAGCTLLQSTDDAPFVEYWNYTSPSIPNSILPTPVHQYFNASIRAQQYASGGSATYQKAFYIVLSGVCILNALALGYFVVHKDWYTDFSEPANLFAVGINSPPSEKFVGCCATGPRAEHFRVGWRLCEDGGHVYVESQEDARVEIPSGLLKRRTWGKGEKFEMSGSPVARVYAKL